MEGSVRTKNDYAIVIESHLPELLVSGLAQTVHAVLGTADFPDARILSNLLPRALAQVECAVHSLHALLIIKRMEFASTEEDTRQLLRGCKARVTAVIGLFRCASTHAIPTQTRVKALKLIHCMCQNDMACGVAGMQHLHRELESCRLVQLSELTARRMPATEALKRVLHLHDANTVAKGRNVGGGEVGTANGSAHRKSATTVAEKHTTGQEADPTLSAEVPIEVWPACRGSHEKFASAVEAGYHEVALILCRGMIEQAVRNGDTSEVQKAVRMLLLSAIGSLPQHGGVDFVHGYTALLRACAAVSDSPSLFEKEHSKIERKAGAGGSEMKGAMQDEADDDQLGGHALAREILRRDPMILDWALRALICYNKVLRVDGVADLIVNLLADAGSNVSEREAAAIGEGIVEDVAQLARAAQGSTGGETLEDERLGEVCDIIERQATSLAVVSQVPWLLRSVLAANGAPPLDPAPRGSVAYTWSPEHGMKQLTLAVMAGGGVEALSHSVEAALAQLGVRSSFAGAAVQEAVARVDAALSTARRACAKGLSRERKQRSGGKA